MKAIHKAKIFCTKQGLRRWFRIRLSVHLHLKALHAELTRKLHPVKFYVSDDKIRGQVSCHKHTIYTKQQNKLNIYSKLK